jgi:TolB-like protein/tetratricopeptide (TPR) repeat protein/predicted Ser/Thr protein kinase
VTPDWPGVRKALGHYEVLRPLGSGGMGEVFIARDPILARKVAIKVLPIRLAGDRDTLARFTQEARSASALNHPNIVTIHEVGAHEGVPFIVMEYVEGQDLRHLIEQGPVRELKLLDIASQIADGLAAAHERGIVHRDLKPENLMITTDGYVKILDFGLAKMLPLSSESSNTSVDLEMPGTRPGTILGTVGYMSPEQATGKRLDFRSDQFALGAILYELATGTSPFAGETAIDTLSAILHHEPVPIWKLQPTLSIALGGIVERLLSKDPEGRYASSRDLARQLRIIRDRAAAQRNALTQDHAVPRRPPGDSDGPHAARSLRATAMRDQPGMPLVILATLVPLVTVAVAVWIWSSHRQGDLPSRRLVTVVPFSVPAQDPGATYFAEGLSELISVRLAAVPELHVVASPLVSTHEAGMPPRRIAAETGATLLLTGSLERFEQQVTIRYALVEPETQKVVVTNSLTAALADAQRIEDRIVADVCRTLHVQPAGSAAADPALSSAAAQRIYIEAISLLGDESSRDAIDRAIRGLTRLLDGAPHSALVNAALGRAHLARYRRNHEPVDAERAIAFAQKAAQAGAPPGTMHVLIGRVHFATGNWKEAIREFDSELVDAPQGVSQLELAEAYELDGAVHEATARYRRIVAARASAEGFAGIARCAMLSKHFDQAAHAFEQAVALDPAGAQALGGLALSYEMLGKKDEARTAYRRAVGAGLKYVETHADAAAHADIALWLAQLGEGEQAEDHLQSAFELDSRAPAVSFDAGLIATLAGRSSEAAAHIARAKAMGFPQIVIERDPRLHAAN